MVTANHWLRNIVTYTFLANQVLGYSGLDVSGKIWLLCYLEMSGRVSEQHKMRC